MKIGYVRVSTREQNTARQEELMESLGVGRVYIDRMSGKDTERPQFYPRPPTFSGTEKEPEPP